MSTYAFGSLAGETSRFPPCPHPFAQEPRVAS